jgi:hypothetical protein
VKVDTEESELTESEFHEELGALLRRADADGIEVEGGWPCSNADDSHDWDVEVIRVKRPAENEES